MTKVSAPEPEPMEQPEQEQKTKAPETELPEAAPKRARSRGKYIDFAPRKGRPAQVQARRRQSVEDDPAQGFATEEEEGLTTEETTTTTREETTILHATLPPVRTEDEPESPKLVSLETLFPPEESEEPETLGESEEEPVEEEAESEEPGLSKEDPSDPEVPELPDPLGKDEYEEGDPLADFHSFGDESDLEDALANFADDLEDAEAAAKEQEETAAQASFISEEDPEHYVEVLSKVTETTTKTTRRSPFLKNYHIDKRPLSNMVPEKQNLPSQDYLEPTKRPEFRPEEFEKAADPAPVEDEPVFTEEEEAGSKFGMALTIIITVLLGVGVGVFVYLAFFQ